MVRAMNFVLLDLAPVPLDPDARAAAEEQRLKDEERRSDEFLARLLAEAEEIKDRL